LMMDRVLSVAMSVDSLIRYSYIVIRRIRQIVLCVREAFSASLFMCLMRLRIIKLTGEVNGNRLSGKYFRLSGFTLFTLAFRHRYPQKVSSIGRFSD